MKNPSKKNSLLHKFEEKKIFFCFIIICVLQLVLLINSRFTVWPEMILYPYFLNNGFENYKDIINPYFPLLTLFLGYFFKLFGLSVLNLKILTFSIVIVNQIIIFLSTKKIFKSISKALLSNLVYLLISYSFGVNGLWFELALTPFLLTSLILIYVSQDRLKIIFSGLLFGVAVGIKQNSLLFLIPICFFLLTKKRYKDFGFFIIPSLVLGVVTLIYLFLNNIFSDFWFWAVKLTLTYSSQPGFVSMPAIRQYLFILFPLFYLIGLFTYKGFKMNEKTYWLLVGILGIAFAFPRYEDFHLQFIVGVCAIFIWLLPRKYLAVFLLILLLFFGRQGNKLINQPDRFLDNQTFELAEKVSGYKSVYLLNSPDLAYFLAGKLPSKPWAINFPWYFEQPGFEKRFIDGLKEEEINYVVIGNRVGGGKYALGNYIPEKLYAYIAESYIYEGSFGNFQIWRLKIIEGKEYASR